MKKILAVFGTRPEAIKMSPLLYELKKRESLLKLSVCISGQHKEMLEKVLPDLPVSPDYYMDIVREGDSLASLNAEMMRKLDGVVDSAAPDFVMVHGDTATAFCAALAAFYRRIPVMHVEAGLRTWDMLSPYPEEFNRRAVSLIADYHFAPTESARDNLLREGVLPERVFVTGNTVIDALYRDIGSGYVSPILERCSTDRIVLLTAHRRESIGKPILNVFRAVKELADRFEDVTVVCPLHKNPAVSIPAREILGGRERVILTDPLSPMDFHSLLSRCSLVMTDSGGVQEEAAALSKPVLVLRDKTERTEGVDSGALCLAGREKEEILGHAVRILSDPETYASMCAGDGIYGDGHASERIADIICAILRGGA